MRISPEYVRELEEKLSLANMALKDALENYEAYKTPDMIGYEPDWVIYAMKTLNND